jgi:glutamate-1-semialdehyde aminotransferase
MKEVLDRHGILFISDEVQTGWGRTGEHFWGYQAHGITPDVVTFAKGLGNGMAMAGVIASASLMDTLPANSISTFGGNPLSTSAALANLEYILEHDLQTNAYKVGSHLKNRIDGLAERVDAIGKQAAGIQEELVKLENLLRVPPNTRGNVYDDDKSISKISMARYYVGSSKDAPSETAEVYIEQARESLNAAIGTIDNFMNLELQAFRQALAEAGIGLFTRSVDG